MGDVLMGDGFRVNVGCGQFPLPDYLNLDADPTTPADWHCQVPPLPFEDGDVEEVWACHFLEHLTPDEAAAFLAECKRVLVPGGKLQIVVPDFYEIARRYVDEMPDQFQYPPGIWRRAADLDDVCEMFVYSTVQDSPHRWCYDQRTLARTLTRAGFKVTGEIDRYRDPRVINPTWYQCGLVAVKP